VVNKHIAFFAEWQLLRPQRWNVMPEPGRHRSRVAERLRGTLPGDLRAGQTPSPPFLHLVHRCVNYIDVTQNKRKAIRLAPGGGRVYEMGPLRAVFKADGNETGERYSISEWWLDPETKGPGAHSHEEDDIFYVLQGTISFRIGGRWLNAEKGSFVLAPGGILHDFENRSARRAGFLNISVPGGFERVMPGIAEWFRERSPADSSTHRVSD
jgi:quercetin dioxygenase-like cupin family protein